MDSLSFFYLGLTDSWHSSCCFLFGQYIKMFYNDFETASIVSCFVHDLLCRKRKERGTLGKEKVLKSKKRGIYIKIYNSDLLVGQQKQVQL